MGSFRGHPMYKIEYKKKVISMIDVNKKIIKEIMKNRGYKLVKVPSEKNTMVRYIKNKTPYSTEISESELLELMILLRKKYLVKKW
ncbi:MAG: hypothetical protein Q7R52_02395 [archaeon]|nr:hypothetical protein [archaeon]